MYLWIFTDMKSMVRGSVQAYGARRAEMSSATLDTLTALGLIGTTSITTFMYKINDKFLYLKRYTLQKGFRKTMFFIFMSYRFALKIFHDTYYKMNVKTSSVLYRDWIYNRYIFI